MIGLNDSTDASTELIPTKWCGGLPREKRGKFTDNMTDRVCNSSPGCLLDLLQTSGGGGVAQGGSVVGGGAKAAVIGWAVLFRDLEKMRRKIR